MFSRCTALVLCAMAIALLSPAPARAAENPVGTWIGTTEVPNEGTDQVTLVVKKVKDAYTVTMKDSLGQVSPADPTEVRFEEGVLSFSFKLSDGTPMAMRLKVTGDKLAGEWTHPEGGTGAIAFDRKK